MSGNARHPSDADHDTQGAGAGHLAPPIINLVTEETMQWSPAPSTSPSPSDQGLLRGEKQG